MVLCCCGDDEDSSETVIYTWDEWMGNHAVLNDYGGALDSIVLLRTKEDLEDKLSVSTMDETALKRISNIDFAKYDLALCWAANHYIDIVSIENSAGSLVVTTRKKDVAHAAIPYYYYVAVRINKTGLPDERIKYVFENQE